MNVNKKVIAEIMAKIELDGQKGVTSDEERDKLANMLASGQIEGSDYQEYFKNEIGKYDINKLAGEVRGGVKDIIKNAMKLSGDSEHINSVEELAPIEQIIQNTTGKYTKEEVQYAQLFKIHKMSKEFGLEIENVNYKRENAQLKDSNKKLRSEIEVYQHKLNEILAENEKYRHELQARQEQWQNIQVEIDTAEESVNTLPEDQAETCQDIIERTRKSVNVIKQNDQDYSSIDTMIKDVNKAMEEGSITEDEGQSRLLGLSQKLSEITNINNTEIVRITKDANSLRNIAPNIADTILGIITKLDIKSESN